MTRTEVIKRLAGFLERGHLHRAWDFARDLIQSPDETPSLRRALKHGFLAVTLMHRLPASFWDERRISEARQLDLAPIFPAPRVGAVAFPVVYSSSDEGCFVVATVRFVEGGQDELPRPGIDVDEVAHSAMAEALKAARRLSGDPRHFRVALDKPFPEPVRGASCGLAVALAALSRIDELDLDDCITATGEVTAELVIQPVKDVDRKSALLREARPQARLLCPAVQVGSSERVPVERLDDARAASRKPSPRALDEALTEFKKQSLADPSLRFLQFRGFAKIARRSAGTQLQLLEFAVAPSLLDERTSLGETERDLRQRLRTPHLSREVRMELVRSLERLERLHWDSGQTREDWTPTLSLADALHGHQRLTVIGEPGAGKSVLTRLTFLACAEDETGARARALLGENEWYRPDQVRVLQSLRTLLPVRVELGGFAQALLADRALSLEAFIRRQLRTQGARGALQEGLGALLAEGRLLLLCDGLDEAPEDVRDCTVDRVSEFVSGFPRVRVLLTSRPHGYAPRIPDFHHVRLAPLAHSQRRVLIARIHRLVEAHNHPGPEGVRRARLRTNALLLAVTKRKEWEQFISNPLLLTLSALADTNAEGVPEHQVIVFEGFIQTVLQEWRAALRRPPKEAGRLLDTWCAVAFALVRNEQRHGLGRPAFLRMLSAEFSRHDAFDADHALQLALETGLLRESGTTIAFWHSAFAEFLAAKHLVRMEGGLERFWKTPLTPLTLKFSAALLDHVEEDPDTCDALARELLDRDGEGAFQLLHPGLRTVSDWLADGVRVAPGTQERIWEGWLEVLERGPPSPLWGDFGRFATRAAPESVAPRLVARMAQVDDQGIREVREALARLVALAAALEAAARSACERWFQVRDDVSVKQLGAFGRASAGDWTDEVIQVLGKIERPPSIGLHQVAALVQRGGPTVVSRLRSLAHERFPSEEQPPPPTSPQGEEERRGLRHAAACLLAVSGGWDGEVARVLQSAFVSPRRHASTEAFRDLVRFCAHDSVVRDTLLDWMGDDTELGTYSREIVRDIAPLHGDMPERVLERAAVAGGRTRDALEELLVSIGEELKTLPELLRRTLLKEQPGGIRLCAARVLTRLANQDPSLHAALRHGMQSGPDLERTQWAYLSLKQEEGLSRLALETLADCSRSADEQTRAAVYGDNPITLKWKLETEDLEAWLQIASDPDVAAPARLDALLAAERVEAHSDQAGPLLRELLHADDEQVRLYAAQQLFWREEVTPEAAVIVAKGAVRSDRESHELLRLVRNAAPVAQVVVRALLGEFSEVTHKDTPRARRLEVMSWTSVLSGLTRMQPACTADLLQSLQHPGFVGRVSLMVLMGLMEEHEPVREALNTALQQAVSGTNALTGFHLAWLGLQHSQTSPQAILLAHALAPQALPQADLERLAYLLHQAGDDRKAAELWRLVLEGSDLELVLEAAEMLVQRFPEEALEWIQPALPHLLDSSAPEHRIGAACIAFRFGLFEEEALRALTRCLDQQERRAAESPGRIWGRHFASTHMVVANSVRDELLNDALHHTQRADFAAMYELCVHRPAKGLALLTSWLRDEDVDRFSRALRVLAAKAPYRDQICSALEHRMSSAPVRSLRELIQLIDDHGFYSEQLVEVFLARVDSERSAGIDFDSPMYDWAQRRPEIWKVIRRQPLSLRDRLEPWIDYVQHIQQDLVAFAVEQVLFHAAVGMSRSAESKLECWSREEPQSKQEPRPRWNARQVRKWMGALLLEQEISTNLSVIDAFDRLATLAELSPHERMRNLLPALDVEPGSVEEDEDSRRWRYLQGLAALRLLELGAHDARIPSILSATVLLLAEDADIEALRFIHALKAVMPPNEALRNSLLHVVRHALRMPSLDQVLDLLDWVGLSIEERIDVLAFRLTHFAGHAEPLELLDVLTKWGCPPARRAALITQQALLHQEWHSQHVLLELAARPELNPAERARLVLSALSQASAWESKEVFEHWIAGFASQSRLDADDRWSALGEPGYLSLRQRTLVKLSKVDDPALLEQVLAGFVESQPHELITLYRAACTAVPLPNEQWRHLLDLLSRRPHDANTARLAKEWLMLGLWQAREPETLNPWLGS
ncbi:hypothetical protein JYJ95_18565 [Corallococcus exiguus]|uniref:hypothetical protein n=1 Tax=Corallococcus exiguus TaxID=83462 RepID=UPI001A8D1E45|nr:hypothetical protein [Corallococcus exiguus]MBN8468522.1 hypothetical protein [Corallococcus exiguus]